MKITFLVLCVVATMMQHIQAQNNITLPEYNKYLLLETEIDTTANASFADFDGDGHLDILLVKGRHWPIVDRVLLGNGRGSIKRAYNLSNVADRSYTGGVADFNGDGFPDIAVSNDAPNKKLIYLNDGKGNFMVGAEFGLPDWPTRNLSIADINSDGFPDIILANRGKSPTSNYICLNKGKGQFNADCISFAPYPSTTITPSDVNNDGFIDLVVPHRNGGQGYVYLGSSGIIFSDNHRIPFGESDATIRVASVGDFNADNILDIVAIDENKGVKLYFGQTGETFSAGISIADSKIAPYALAISDMNNDGKIDIIVGHIKAPSTVFLNDGTGRNFLPISFGDSKGTVYGLAIGDFNEDGTPDIATARSDAQSVLYFGKIKSKNRK